MPRPKNPNPNVRLHISVPARLAAELKLRFFSELYVHGFEKGRLSDFFIEAAREKLERERGGSQTQGEQA